MLRNNADAHRCSHFELELPLIYSATKWKLVPWVFLEMLVNSLIVKPKIELRRNYNMSGGLETTDTRSIHVA